MATKSSNKVMLDTFLAMTPEAPGFSPKSQHYLLAGVNPTYYTDVPGIQEEQNAPLVASLNWQQITATLDGNVIAMCSASLASQFSIFVMTNTTQVYGITSTNGIPTGVTSMGYPSGSSVPGTTHGDLTCVNNYLYAGYSLLGNFWKMNNFSTPNWTTVSSSIPFSLNSLLVPFNKYCMLSGGSKVIPIDGSFTSYTGIDIGTGWQITGMLNYTDKYLAVGGVNAQYMDYNQNYLFLWDGISPQYNYAIRLPGTLIDMIVINGILNLAIQVTRNKTQIFTLNSNTQIVPGFISAYSGIDTGGFTGTFPIDTKPLFNFNGNLAMRLASNASLTYPLLVSGQTPVGNTRFILSSGNKFSRILIGSDGTIYASNYVLGGVDTLWYYPSSGTSYQPINYISNWIPSKNASSVKIYYNSPPVSNTDVIQVTIQGVGEDIVPGSETITLNPITNANFLTYNKSQLDLQGFTGDWMRIQLTTVNNGPWRPLIRGIKLVIGT